MPTENCCLISRPFEISAMSLTSHKCIDTNFTQVGQHYPMPPANQSHLANHMEVFVCVPLCHA